MYVFSVWFYNYFFYCLWVDNFTMIRKLLANVLPNVSLVWWVVGESPRECGCGVAYITETNIRFYSVSFLHNVHTQQICNIKRSFLSNMQYFNSDKIFRSKEAEIILKTVLRGWSQNFIIFFFSLKRHEKLVAYDIYEVKRFLRNFWHYSVLRVQQVWVTGREYYML